MDDATHFGSERVRLDTGPFMRFAHRIYEAASFADRAPYEQAEVPVEFHAGWRFMERSLPGFEHQSLRREQP